MMPDDRQLIEGQNVSPAAKPQGLAGSAPRTRKWGWGYSDPLLSKIGLELFAVFAGVTAAFAVDDYRSQRDQGERRQAIYRALDRELKQMAETHGPVFQREMTQELAAWDQALQRGERPLPPAFKLPGAERPPTGVWDAAVASDSIELVDPELFYELARFYNRANSVGNLYQRYAASAQSDVWPYLADGPTAFWQPNGQLRPEIQAHVQRLRDFQTQQRRLGLEAQQLRKELNSAAERQSNARNGWKADISVMSFVYTCKVRYWVLECRMAEYRRGIVVEGNNALWHFHPDCPSFPRNDYEIRGDQPQDFLCARCSSLNCHKARSTAL